MCSSFTDGAAAVILAGPAVACARLGAPYRRLGGPLGQRPHRLPRPAGPDRRGGLGRLRLGPRRRRHRRAARRHRAPRSSSPSSRSASSRRARPVPATEAGATGVDSPGLVVNPSGGLVGRGHPLGATGLAQVVELATQFRGPRRRAPGRRGARLGVAVNTGGIIYGDAGFVGIHAVRAGIGRVTGIRITGWGIAVPDKVVTNDDLAVRLDTSDEWIVERTGIRERRIGGTTSGLAIEAAQAALARAGRDARRHRQPGAGHHDARRPGARHGADRAARDRHARRRVRPQRRLLGLRLRPRRRGRAHRRWLRAGAADRLRDALPHHRHGRPQDRHPGRRRRRRRRRRAGGRPGRPAQLEPELRRLAAAPAQVRARRHARTWTARRSSAGPSGSSSSRRSGPWPTPGSVPTTSR